MHRKVRGEERIVEKRRANKSRRDAEKRITETIT